MPQRPSAERRLAERRTPTPRRAAPHRRSGRYRRGRDPNVVSDAVKQERRSAIDRRTGGRRAGRRLRRFDRRVGNRRLGITAVFLREEILRIRESLSKSTMKVQCPSCNGPLALRSPMARNGSTLREVRCAPCRRSVTITDYGVSRILVVDDEEVIRDTLRTIFTRAGHEVARAPDGEVGLRYYGENPADAVFIDMVMPVMGGLEFIRQCRKVFPDARIVAMSGTRRYAARDPLAMARQLGAAQILRKPFTADQVLSVLDEVLELDRAS